MKITVLEYQEKYFFYTGFWGFNPRKTLLGCVRRSL